MTTGLIPKSTEGAKSHSERLAVNLTDLDRLPAAARAALLGGKLDPKAENLARVAGKPEEVGVVFTCPLLKAACVCDVLRASDRNLGDNPIRVYVQAQPGAPWYRLPKDAILVYTKSDNSLVLNPELFPESGKLAELPYQPPKAERVL